jgi:hypothetical protein
MLNALLIAVGVIGILASLAWMWWKAEGVLTRQQEPPGRP